MANTRMIEEESARPKYYEVDGALKANANRAWLLAFLTIPLALISLGFAVFLRLQPPMVIRIAPNGNTSVLHKQSSGMYSPGLIPGTDEFLTEAFVKRFLASYLNYTPEDVDEHWKTSLNMMTLDLSSAALKSMKNRDLRGKISDEQIQSVFHLRELDPVPGEKFAFLAYGVKDVHHVVKGVETTDHFVNEYHIRLKTDIRTERNPDGLWVAEFNEVPIDNERRSLILAMPDAEMSQE